MDQNQGIYNASFSPECALTTVYNGICNQTSLYFSTICSARIVEPVVWGMFT